VKLSPKKDASVSLPLKVGKKKVPQEVADDNNKILSDNTKPSKIVGVDETKQCKDVGSDNGQDSDNAEKSDTGHNDICNVTTMVKIIQIKLMHILQKSKVNFQMIRYLL